MCVYVDVTSITIYTNSFRLKYRKRAKYEYFLFSDFSSSIQSKCSIIESDGATILLSFNNFQTSLTIIKVFPFEKAIL